jgi:hypothetical protein
MKNAEPGFLLEIAGDDKLSITYQSNTIIIQLQKSWQMNGHLQN